MWEVFHAAEALAARMGDCPGGGNNAAGCQGVKLPSSACKCFQEEASKAAECCCHAVLPSIVAAKHCCQGVLPCVAGAKGCCALPPCIICSWMKHLMKPFQVQTLQWHVCAAKAPPPFMIWRVSPTCFNVFGGKGSALFYDLESFTYLFQCFW
eukprot:1159275-Pelagomonas_calceolata.AAC.8